MLARAAIILGVLSAVLLVASGPMYQLGMLSLAAAYNGLRLAVVAGAAAMIVGSTAVCVALRRKRRVQALLGTAAFLAGIVAVVIPIRAQARARSAPAVADVSTDVQDPPAFRVLADLPDGRRRDLTRPPQLDARQRRAYPDIGPITVPTPPDMAFEEALETISELDWQVEDGSEAEGRIEATARSGWFGFKDDLVVRLTRVPTGTRVDVRSVARDAATDMGRNAENVREFLAEMRR